MHSNSAKKRITNTTTIGLENSQLEENLNKYIDQHGLRAQMVSNYALQAFTMATNEDYLITVQHLSTPLKQEYVSFQDYAQGRRTEYDQEFKDSLEAQRGYLFNVLKKDDYGLFSSISKRVWDKKYTKCVFSNDCTKVLMIYTPQAKLNMRQGICFDAYDVSDFGFFDKKEPINPEDSSFLYSYVNNSFSKAASKKTIFEFSQDDNFILVKQKNSLKLLPIPENNETKTLESKDYKEINIDGNNTYDKILNVYVDKDNIDNSLVVLQSSSFSMIQIISYKACIDNLTKNLIANAMLSGGRSNVMQSLGGSFIQEVDGRPDIKQKVQLFDSNGHKSQIECVFAHDGKKLIVSQQDSCFALFTNMKNPEYYGHKKSLPHLDDGNYKIFNRKKESFLFLEHCDQQSSLSVNFYQPKVNEKFQDLSITIHAFKDGLNITDCKELDDGTLRIVCIRGDEEILIWEYTDGSNGKVVYRDNRRNTSAIRWPYFAYQINETIFIHPLFDPKVVVYISSQVEENQSFVGLCFSEELNLYFCADTDDSVQFYQIDILSNLKCDIDDDQETKDHDDEQQDIEYIKKLGLAPKTKHMNAIYDWKVVEQKIGRRTRVSFTILSNYRLILVSFFNKKIDVQKISKNVESIQDFNPNQFLYFTKESNEISLLDITDANNIQDTTLHKEQTKDLIKVLSNRSKLFVLCKSKQNEYFLKTFDWIDSVLTYNSYIQIDSKEKEFIQIFQNSRTIIDNIIIMKDSLVKIYEDPTNARIQTFENFLPDIAPEDIALRLVLKDTLNCQRHRRFALFMNNPETCEPRRIIFLPYLGDNSIRVNTQPNQITWFNTQQRTISDDLRQRLTETDYHLETTLMQFNYQKLSLNQYTMNGLRSKKTVFKSAGKKLQILTQMPEKPVCLTTERDNDYLKKIKFLEIIVQFDQENEVYNHVLEEEEIDLQEIKIWRDDLEEDEVQDIHDKSLYRAMARLKQDWPKADFHFQINNNRDVAIGCVNGFTLLEVVVLKKGAKYAQRSQIFKISNNEHDEFLDEANQEGIHQSLIDKKKNEYQNKKFSKYGHCDRFLLCDDKLVVYGPKKVYFASLQEDYQTLKLEKSDFEVPANSENTIIDNVAQTSRSNEEGNCPVVFRLLSSVGQIQEAVIYNVFSLEKNREKYSLESTMESLLFFDSNRQPFILDKKGMTQIQSKELLLQYHIQKQNLYLNDLAVGLDWGSRFYYPDEYGSDGLAGSIFVAANNMILPYSYLSFIQHYEQKEIKKFNTDDFYKVNGEIILHKFINKPHIIEKILADFYKQDKIFTTSILMNKGTENGIDLLQQILDLNLDKLGNNILKYLSELPIKYSFYQLVPVYNMLFDYKNFGLLLDKWFQQTPEMKEVTVLLTEKDSGLILKNHNSQILDREFYHKFRSHKESAAEFDQNNNSQGTMTQTNLNLGNDLKWEIMSRKPVDIRCFYASWLFKSTTDEDDSGRKFFSALARCDDISFFKNLTIQKIIQYRWEVAYEYMIKQFFLPFMILCYIPYTVFAIMSCELTVDQLYNSNNTWIVLAYQLQVLLIAIYVFIQIFVEIYEFRTIGWQNYLTNAENIFDACQLLILIATLIISMGLLYGDEVPEDNAELASLRNLQTFGVLIANVQLFNMLRMFDFFASFVRSMIEIIKTSMPLLTVLVMVVFTFAICFTLQDNNNNPERMENFFVSIINSYRMSLGDFQVTEEAGSNEFIFWFLFLLGTVISMLILLNMIIAVMSLTFEQVSEENEAYIYREKLNLLLSKDFFIKGAVEKLSKTKYLISFDVDPSVTNDITEVEQLQMTVNQLKNDFKNFSFNVTEKDVAAIQRHRSLTALTSDFNTQTNEGIQNLNERLDSMEKMIEKLANRA